MIKLITAPDELHDSDAWTKVFLAGGIQRCPDWQLDMARRLSSLQTGGRQVALINPRQPAFDMVDPLAVERQIEWEFRYLNSMDMFTMFFYGPTESDQPICFYELGRYIEVMRRRFPADWSSRIVVTTCSAFKWRENVIVQTRLATDGKVDAGCLDTYEEAISRHSAAVSAAIGGLIG